MTIGESYGTMGKFPDAVGSSSWNSRSSGVPKPPSLHCVTNDFGSTFELKFFHEVCFVGFDRLNANIQLIGDLFIAVPVSNQPQNLFFTIGQFLRIGRTAR